jgi:hypothetical protein
LGKRGALSSALPTTSTSGLAANRNIDYAWTSFEIAIENGILLTRGESRRDAFGQLVGEVE